MGRCGCSHSAVNSRFKSEVDMIKFVCRDIWQQVYGKQVHTENARATPSARR
jgi:hypothetical protein